ncbi:MAG: hypothetical protein QNK26_13590 [Moritella sp.]|uniref:hypothetical protein n=1 Tax=Moritella sp. TaxID=78556 RepID=UPI0029A94E7D|nr:hypothetical protein [Moritella sp.]MDX2321614.1 hypothetical protein [Moritella sp.]
MESDLYFNFLWLAPLVAYFTTRDKPQITRNIITATSLGLVVTYGLKGLYALYFMWPVSDIFGQCVFYLRFIHDVSATRIAILLQIVTFN